MDTLDRIIALINERCESEQEFVRDLALGRNTVSEWKNGKTKSYNKRLPEIAEYLNTTTAYLVGETDDPNPPQKTPKDIKIIEEMLKERGAIPKDRYLTRAELERLLELLEVAVKMQEDNES